MNIAMVTPVFPPDNGWGGIGTYVHHLAPALVERGHRVTILCGYRAEPSVLEQGGLRIVRRIRTEGTTSAERSQQIARLLEEEIESQGIEVVEFGEYGGDGVMFQRRHANFPVVVKMHCPTRLCSMGEAPPWQAWFRRHYLPSAPRVVDRLERESVERAKRVLSPSLWLLEALRALGWTLPTTAALVRNPFGGWPNDLPPPAGDRSDTEPRVLLLGRLARLKGVDLFPEIFAHVWRERPETRFELVGQDTWHTRGESWRQTIARRIDPRRCDQLHFHGGVAHAELLPILARSAVALFASRWDNSPYTLMECMGAGLACVVGSGGGAQELGEHEVSVLNTANEPAAIAAGVTRLLNDPKARRRLGSAARERVGREFAPSRIALEMLRHYREAAGSGPVPAGPCGRREPRPGLEDGRSAT